MYNQPYFMPGYYSTMAAPSMMRGAMGGAMNGAMMRGAGRGLGLFGRLGNSLASLRSLNWGGFINNASKTLGVINQTIPLVRQVGPMVNNMKSMLRVASIFKDETDKKPTRKSGSTSSYPSRSNYDRPHSSQSGNLYSHPRRNSNPEQDDTHLEHESDSSPTFFIGS